MKFDLKRPCPGCPFGTGPKSVRRLGEARAQEIVDALRGDASFSCHETVDYSREKPRETHDTQHCAGAMILLEREERPNQMMRWMERVGFYDHTKLDMGAAVVADFDEFVEVQSA